jgi:cation:H+ antiporter
LLKDLIVFIIGLVVIYKSADFFTDGAEGLAIFFGISRLLIGLTVVSFATSLPEFIVSFTASLMNHGGMAVGNIVGSCMANIGLVLAPAAIISPLRFNLSFIKEKLFFLIGAVIFLYLFMWDGVLNFFDGILLSILLLIFVGFLIRRHKDTFLIDNKDDIKKGNFKNNLFKFSLGFLGIILAAKYAIIPKGVNIARYMGVPEIVIGLSLVAIGTSLPELATALVASFKKMTDMVVGTVIGSNILNILWILGFSSLARPLNIDNQTRFVTMPVMLAITVVMTIFAGSKLRLSRGEGVILLFVYVSYIFYLFRFAY